MSIDRKEEAVDQGARQAVEIGVERRHQETDVVGREAMVDDDERRPRFGNVIRPDDLVLVVEASRL